MTTTKQDERVTILKELDNVFNMVKVQKEEIIKSEKEYNEISPKGLKEEVINDIANESISDRISRIEGVYNRKEEIVRKNETIRDQIKDGISMLRTMINIYHRLEEIRFNDGQILSEHVDKIISKVMETEVKRIDKLINENPHRKYRYQGELDRKAKEWESRRVEENFLPSHQMTQIEMWSRKKAGNVVFDSKTDEWDKDTSVFDKNIMYREHLMIIITDTEGNRFGGYINSYINGTGYWINDPNAFVFSLESKGRKRGMMKFDIKEPQDAFYLCNQSSDWLFGFGKDNESGYDIGVYKESNKAISYCHQHSYDYNSLSNALCGKQHPEHFIPKRIIVIEMN
ncbi:hypothetical protein ENU1_134920 [Entamoeba nuttalli P19]|uniref:TLDc domain-containing protein n=1 Tax=Entamoeba nuttalli (strain P19) TaxID=1076696 RepID=K2HT39_ENTNP|nr:hypothetical protein ENU1_134920 [Entamoeba nuttalli P19]EKE39280.1 hypothetical protein ENU1_134920 [Entamoeba nuttalli P19]|eukprot:XP_008858385.1 hypothetical protein ENU1_134920 [Entamoeba nuttalli P19]